MNAALVKRLKCEDLGFEEPVPYRLIVGDYRPGLLLVCGGQEDHSVSRWPSENDHRNACIFAAIVCDYMVGIGI